MKVEIELPDVSLIDLYTKEDMLIDAEAVNIVNISIDQIEEKPNA